MTAWDGKDRRKEREGNLNSAMDHLERDRLLTQIDANLSNFMRRMEDHVGDDGFQFRSIGEKLNETNKKVDRNTWYTAVGIGILAAVEFFKDKIFK